MPVIFIANVGERDLYYQLEDELFYHFQYPRPNDQTADGYKVAQALRCQPGARHIGQTLLALIANNPDVLSRFRYPIIKTALKQVVGECSIDILFLAVTNQEGVPAHHSDRDSLHSGAVLKLLITRDFGERVRQVEFIHVKRDPQNNETAYEFWGAHLEGREGEPAIPPPAQVEQAHVCLSGGVPAMSSGLADQARRLYKERCHLYQVDPLPPEAYRKGAEEGELRQPSVNPFLRDLAVELMGALIDRYDYSGAREALRIFRAVQAWPKTIEPVLEHAERRVNLNFKEASDVISRYRTNPLRAWRDEISEADLLDRLIETSSIAAVRYHHREYTELIWRIRSIYENGLRLLAAETLGLDELKTNDHMSKASLAKAYPELSSQVASSGRVRPLGALWETNREFLRMLLEYAFKTRVRSDIERWQDIYDLLSTLEGLAGLANDMLHNFRGIAEGDLNTHFKPHRRIEPPVGAKHHEWIIPTLQLILRLFLELTSPEADLERALRSPLIEINEYLKETLQQRHSVDR